MGVILIDSVAERCFRQRTRYGKDWCVVQCMYAVEQTEAIGAMKPIIFMLPVNLCTSCASGKGLSQGAHCALCANKAVPANRSKFKMMWA